MRDKINLKKYSPVLFFGLVLVLTAYLVLANSQEITLTNDNPTKEVSFDGRAYSVELVSASTTTATIKITDDKGYAESKEVAEGYSKDINGLAVKVVSADATNFALTASLIVEKSSSSDTNMTYCKDSDGGKNYAVRGKVVKGDIVKEDSCQSFAMGLCPNEGPCDTPAPYTVLYEQYCEGNEIKTESKDCNNCVEGVCKDGQSSDDLLSFTLTNTKPTNVVKVSGESYTVELLSASDTSATVKTSQTKVISELDSKKINGLDIAVKDATSTNFNLSVKLIVGTSTALAINEGSVGDVACENSQAFILTNENPSKLISYCGESYFVELLSASDNDATLKVASKTKEIVEGSSANLGGLNVKVKEASSSNYVLSASLSVQKAESEIEKEDKTDIMINGLRFVLTNDDSIVGVSIDGRINIIQLLSASNDDVTLRVINEQGNSETKTISEGKSEAIKGVVIQVWSASADNFELSTEILVLYASHKVDLEKVSPDDKTGPLDIPDKKEAVCDGCKMDNKCYPLAYRKNGQFCSDNKEFIIELEAGQKCENNFECTSNICISDECVSEGLLRKVLNWFKSLFGGED